MMITAIAAPLLILLAFNIGLMVYVAKQSSKNKPVKIPLRDAQAKRKK